jgi:hypothetical protein
MKFPFSVEEFLNVFEKYNEAIFPLQIIFYVIAFFCVYLLFAQQKNGNKFICGLLSFFWFWIGIVYHLIFFSTINKAAYLFGILFILQGVLFIYYGIAKEAISFEYRKSFNNYAGILFIIYAFFIYPVLGFMFGHKYPSAPTFGLPCPTTIFTFGILLFANKRISVAALIIPLLWSIIGFGAALKLSVYEDFGLLCAGTIGLTLLIVMNKNQAAKA